MTTRARLTLWAGALLLMLGGALAALIVFSPRPVTADPECVAARARFWEEHPNTLLTLADCGPYYRSERGLLFGELPPGPFLFGAEDLEAARAADRPRRRP